MNGLFQKITNAPDNISVRTAERWMKYLGFQPTKATKGWFMDGHERADVVLYRSIYYGIGLCMPMPWVHEGNNKARCFSGQVWYPFSSISGSSSISKFSPLYAVILLPNSKNSSRNCDLYSTTSALSWPSMNQPFVALVGWNPRYFIHLSAVLTLMLSGALVIFWNNPFTSLLKSSSDCAIAVLTISAWPQSRSWESVRCNFWNLRWNLKWNLKQIIVSILWYWDAFNSKSERKVLHEVTGRVIFWTYLKSDVCQLQGAHGERWPFSDVLFVPRSIEWIVGAGAWIPYKGELTTLVGKYVTGIFSKAVSRINYDVKRCSWF